MTPDDKAKELGIDFAAYTPPANLAPATRIGNTIYTSGHVSVGYKGKLGQDMSVEQGQAAARVCAVQLLQAVHSLTGTLNTVRCIRLLGAVNSTPEFTDQHLVINGASQLIWDILGKDGNGFHARSALGFAALPTGVAVEVEGIFEVIEEAVGG
jgi:enamine deaminase RidA (YjgF/YER057c/UK114 family)